MRNRFFSKSTQNGKFWPKCKGGTRLQKHAIKRSFLANNLNQTADRKPKVTNSPMATKTTLTYLLLMNSFSFWQLENAKAKCRIEKINKFALDSADENCRFERFEKHPTCCINRWKVTKITCSVTFFSKKYTKNFMFFIMIALLLNFRSRDKRKINLFYV